MNPAHLKKALILPTVLLTFSLISCAAPMIVRNPNGSSGGYTTYTTLPQDYSGTAYLVDGRYYTGGQYQNGSYTYLGRNYNNRYLYNGQYYYGGDHRSYGSTIPVQNNAYYLQNSGFRTYTTLPQNYSGSAYLLNGRYYTGGQYQSGTYTNLGRNYNNRYFYDGQYYYGGNHTAYGDAIAAQNNNGLIQ